MKIGITTFWETKDNYGQMLQAWALQQVLIHYGHEPFIIRYQLRGGKPATWVKTIKTLVKAKLLYPLCKRFNLIDWAVKVGIVYDYMSIHDRCRCFDKFREEELHFSNQLYETYSSLIENPPSADVYITGSDQVWSPSFRKVYFLQFGDKSVKRISYAPSFGVQTYPQEKKANLKEALMLFDAISVREKQGAEICNDVGFKAEWVLDPTLLLNSEDYLNHFVPNSHKSDEDYAFIYSINILKSENIHWEELLSILNASNTEAIVTPASGYYQSRELFDGCTYVYATIPEWLNLINKSKFVVTTSFHGVMFSILFHKNFVYFPLTDSFSEGNNRVVEILQLLGLTSKIWEKGSNYETVLSASIDWVKVDAILKDHRQLSLDFLEKSLHTS